MNKDLLPHFLIVGAPKCGTTSLHFYISQHPDINTSPKEIHYFGKDLKYKTKRPKLEEYQNHFSKKGLNGDASVWYLYSDSIFEELKNLGITPKIIILIRNPTEVAYSLHSQNIVDANEDVLSFESALKLEEQRKKGLNMPKGVDPLRTVLYRDTVSYFPRIKKFQDEMGIENVWVGLQENLKHNPAFFLKEIELFLNLSQFTSYDFTRQNENKTVKSKKINYYIKKAGSFQIAIFRFLIPFKGLRKKIVDSIYFRNLEVEKRTKLKSTTKLELEQEFNPGIKKLNNIIEPDISHWIV